jgi:hypothetical protein
LTCEDSHDLVLQEDGDAVCSRCGEGGFPVSPEAAGVMPCCGAFYECLETCDGTAREPWALAKEALAELDALTGDQADLVSRFASVRVKLLRIRYGGHLPGESIR